MEVQKPKRLKSSDNLQKIRRMSCSICFKPAPSDAHHVKTWGAGGDDELSNLMPLCRLHHNEFHSMGRETFFRSYMERVDYHRSLYGLPKLEYL